MHQEDHDKAVGFLGTVSLLSSLITWAGSGWLLWNWYEVDGFIDGVIWIFLWGIVGGLAQIFIAPIPMVILMLIISSFEKNKD